MSDPRHLESVVLRDLRDESGPRHLEAAWREDGAIVIAGQDLGPGVERVWGEGLREYEWEWTIGPEAIPAMVEALGGAEGDDPLALVKAWFDTNGGLDPGIHLREAGVPIQFWSRVGD